MPTLKDALDLIGKLTKTEQESLKMILLRPSPTRALDIEEFLTDKMNSYKRFASKNNIDLVQLKSGKSKQGIYNIQHINSYHSELKRSLYSFKGVSTKYLNNYLIWHNFVNYAKETDEEKKIILLTYVMTTSKSITNQDLSNRPAIPLLV